MKNVVIANDGLTMSSREIADYTNKEHKNVTRDIDKMLKELGLDVLKFERIYKDSLNRKQKVYNLPKDLTITLVSGYDVVKRKKIIDRWLELEKQQYEKLTNLSRIDILKMAIEAEEKSQELQQENRLLETSLEASEQTVKVLKPMADYGQKIFDSSNTYTSTNAALEIGLKSANSLNLRLKLKKVIKKGTGSADWALCSKYAGFELTTYKKIPVTHSNGETETRMQMRWTRKGLDWLIKNFKEGKL